LSSSDDAAYNIIHKSFAVADSISVSGIIHIAIKHDFFNNVSGVTFQANFPIHSGERK